MENENVELMLKAPVPKAILTLSVPTVLSTVVALLYNLTDTYFVGLLDDPVQLGGDFSCVSCIYGDSGHRKHVRKWCACLYFPVSWGW